LPKEAEVPLSWLNFMSGNKIFTWHVVGSRGLAGRMILGMNDSLYELLEFSDGVYFIRMLIKDRFNGFVWNLVFVYGPPQNGSDPFFTLWRFQYY
jgi:hypothetical protein